MARYLAVSPSLVSRFVPPAQAAGLPPTPFNETSPALFAGCFCHRRRHGCRCRPPSLHRSTASRRKNARAHNLCGSQAAWPVHVCFTWFSFRCISPKGRMTLDPPYNRVKAIGAIASHQLWTIGAVDRPHTSHTPLCYPQFATRLTRGEHPLWWS